MLSFGTWKKEIKKDSILTAATSGDKEGKITYRQRAPPRTVSIRKALQVIATHHLPLKNMEQIGAMRKQSTPPP